MRPRSQHQTFPGSSCAFLFSAYIVILSFELGYNNSQDLPAQYCQLALCTTSRNMQGTCSCSGSIASLRGDQLQQRCRGSRVVTRRQCLRVQAAKTADGPSLAIVGVTGAVGQEFLRVRTTPDIQGMLRFCPYEHSLQNKSDVRLWPFTMGSLQRSYSC